MKIGRVIDALWRERNRFRRVPEERERAHVATYAEAVVYFTFAFGSTPLSPHALAQRLLAAELAETVTSPADGEVRMAPRYEQLVRLIRRAERLAEADRALAGGRLTGWGSRHPVQAMRLAAAVLNAKTRRMIGGPDDSSTSGGEKGNDDVGATMSGVVAEINEAVAHRQVLNAIQHAREQDMYQPGYLESEPYLRLTLRRVNFGLAGFSDQDEVANGQHGDVLLLVHRSGVLHLSVAVRMPEGLSTDELIPRTIASGVGLSWTEVAEPVVDAASRDVRARQREWPGEWLPSKQEGTRWRRYDHAGPVSLVDLFRLYRDAIGQVSDVDLGDEWFCYPVVCIDRLGCCGIEGKWTAQHRDELQGVMMRYQGYRGLRERSTLSMPPDDAITPNHSVWHTTASTTLMSWSRRRQRFDDHLWTLLLTENFLLQYWQLQALNVALQKIGAEPTAKTARDLQRRLIFGLEEFYRSSLAFGTAQDRVARLLQESGSERMQAQMRDRLDQLGSVVAAERADRAAARATAATVAGFGAAVVLGLPAIDQTMKLVRAIPKGGVAGRLASPLRAVAESGAVGSYICYLAVLLILLASLTLYALPQRRRRRRHVRRAGQPWPSGTIRVVRRNEASGQDGAATGPQGDA